MPDLFNIGVSALVANRAALTTTGHNIANVNTEGFSRQRADMVTRPPQITGVGAIGKGVAVEGINRIADQFVTRQLQTTTSNEANADAYVRFAKQVDNYLGDGTFTPALDQYFAAMHDVNNDPASIPARLVFLEAASGMVARFHDADARLTDVQRGVNNDIVASINQINAFAEEVGRLNQRVVEAIGSSGEPPNDLLDQRDELIRQLSELVNVSTTEQRDGSINVFVGSGQILVTGSRTMELVATQNATDASRLEISVKGGTANSEISDLITNGRLGGVLKFRDEVLDPTRNAIGRLAYGLATTQNEQHREGMDLNGQLGGDLFSIGNGAVTAAATNTGAVSISIDPNAIDQLTTSDYELVHDGANFVLTRINDGLQTTLSGGGPFNVDGMVITVTTPPAAGDIFSLQPTKDLARTLTLAISEPEALAFANPVTAEIALNNIGNGEISTPTVLDSGDANLLTSVQFVFNDPPSTYQVNGAGPLIPYTPGADIDFQGKRFQISGQPEPGDRFTVRANLDGRGDNANGLALVALQNTELLEGGTASYHGAFSQLVGVVGARTQQAEISQQALKVLRENAEGARNEISGVNLDEEAAAMIRYQQAFEAAAQVIVAANETFAALLDAVRS